MSEAFYSSYSYDTTKTQTTEHNVVTEHGVLQIRIIDHSNGKKREVFAGFEPGDFRAEPGDQKYFKASKKAVDKWQGRSVPLRRTTLDRLVEDYGLQQYIVDRNKECIEQAFGFVPVGKSLGQQEADQKAAWAQAQVAYHERIANDPTYGIF